MLGLIILLSTNTKAQYFYTSYGYAQDWFLPQYIQYSIYDNYYGYDIAHVRRYTKHGHQNFNVLLHRNGWFVELRFDNYGHAYKTIRHKWHYPLSNHVCGAYCGYHHTYYTTYYPKYHHGYTKVVYVNKPKGHKKHHNTYYTNVQVEKQHKQQQYNSNNKTNTRIQQQRTNTVISRPQSTKHQTVERSRPQHNGNSSRIQRVSAPARTTQKATRTQGISRTTTYRNERGSRNR